MSAEDFLPYDRMQRGQRDLRDRYRAGKPFPHVAIDDFFDPSVLDRILDEFPDWEATPRLHYDTVYEDKLTSVGDRGLSGFTRSFLLHLNSGAFVRFCEDVTGIRGLIPDPHFHAGGLHEILPGGRLGIHADFNRHPDLGLERRLNVLVFLNKDWEDEWGGHLELWDPAMQRCETRVAPVFNRMVIFQVTDRTFHGHPEPLACPEGRSRRSIAVYFYTRARPRDEQSPPHKPLFRARPGERLGISLEDAIRRCVPPILVDAYRAGAKGLRNRRRLR